MRLMLIDDDKDDRFIFRVAIKEIGPCIECFAAQDAHEGMELLSNLSPNPKYVLLDINMPKFNASSV